MLNKLSYSVTFTITGHTLRGPFEFEAGFRLITHADEQGKSLIIEVVRWCPSDRPPCAGRPRTTRR